MFANYRYSTVLRRVSPSTQANPKDDPILIGELQGVSGLTNEQVDTGYFSDSSILTSLQRELKESNKYTTKKLEFVGDGWRGFGEFVPVDVVRTYSINGNGVFSYPGLVNGAEESFVVTNNADDDIGSSLNNIYTIHIENLKSSPEEGSTKFILSPEMDSDILLMGKTPLSTNSKVPLYQNIVTDALGYSYNLTYLDLLGSTNTDRTDELIKAALGTKKISFTGNTTDEVAILGRTNASESGSISDLSYNSSVTKRSLSDYSTLAYDQIINKADQGKEGSWSGDFRIKLGKDPRITRKSIDVYGKEIDAGYKDTATKISTINPNGEKDFIPFSITSYAYSGSVSFTAFLTSFNDNISPSWEDVRYVGRQDTLKHFVGVTRTAGVGFKVAAFNRDDIDKIYGKLKNLIKYAGVGGVDKSTVLTAPVVKLTLGSWFSGTPCVVTSIKYDVQLADYAWDIDKNIPQLVDVSLDFFILGDKTGKALNSATNNYLY